MHRGEFGRITAYATAFSGCLLTFLTLGSAVAFLDVAASRYFDLPNWVAAAALAITLASVGWYALWLFARARAFELDPELGASAPSQGTPPAPGGFRAGRA